MRRTQGWTEKKRTGTRVERYECPAEAGYLRCPVKPHTMAYPDDIPLNLNPPDPATAPTCCTQRTIELPEEAQGKLRQKHRWGSDDWIRDHAVFFSLTARATATLCAPVTASMNWPI